MKAIIYTRTSTAEQHPEKQRQECIEFAKQRGYEVIEILEEKLSGFKQIDRPQYEKVKQLAHEGKVQAVIVWALDRWVRNRDTLLEDVTMLRIAGVKLHSVKEQWLEAVNVEGSLGKTIQDFLLGIVGSLAEMESQRKRERTLMAYKNRVKDWGRPAKITDKLKQEVVKLHRQGCSVREIAQSVWFWDKNNNQKFISKSAVHKVIAESKGSPQHKPHSNKEVSMNR
jgi:DNA invertase Pin-like site-specific DNA recombinase